MSRRTEIEVGLTVLVAVGVLLWGVTWLKEFQIQRADGDQHRQPHFDLGSAAHRVSPS